MTAIGTTTVTNNAQSRFGYGALSEIADALPGLGIARPMVCSDRGLREAGLIDRLLADHPEVVPVAYSAMANDHAREQLRSIGVEMLTKSGSADRLVEAIHRLAPPSREAPAAT